MTRTQVAPHASRELAISVCHVSRQLLAALHASTLGQSADGDDLVPRTMPGTVEMRPWHVTF